jgi:iron-sulfur cluster assembly accessory protein
MTQTTELKQYVTKDMVIADVLKKYPDVALIMLEHGLHCVGCHANVFDTVEAGCKVHGLDDKTIDSMLVEINKFVAEDTKAKKAQPSGPAKVLISEGAAAKIKDLQKKDKMESFGLRVSVMPGGCSGFVYQMNFEKAPEKTDLVLEDRGIKMFIDADSLEMLRGAEIDYVETLNDSGFKVNNPNAKQSCGCGKSFG